MTAGTAERVRAKRVYERAEPEDGRRILITRYWPRGVPKSAADEYASKLAPSRELLNAVKHEDLAWAEFTRRYREEMSSPEALAEIARLAETARTARVTVMCVCDSEDRCHRYILRDLIANWG